MNKWELTKILIDSKKDVDSILYIAEYGKELNTIDLYEEVQAKLQNFYVNLRILYDKRFHRQELKALCDSDSIVRETKYHADKRYAHRDEDYNAYEPDTLFDLVEKLKKEIMHCKELCKDILPDSITLDFVPHDKKLFRMRFGITKEKEEAIIKALHPAHGIPVETTNEKTVNVFNNVDEIKKVNDSSEYCVLMEDGITWSEKLQNRQDSVIKINVLYGLNIWCSLNNPNIKKDDDEMILFLKHVKLI